MIRLSLSLSLSLSKISSLRDKKMQLLILLVIENVWKRRCKTKEQNSTSFFKQTIVVHWTGFACWLWEMHVWLTISWGKILLALLLPARFVLKVCCHACSPCFPLTQSLISFRAKGLTQFLGGVGRGNCLGWSKLGWDFGNAQIQLGCFLPSVFASPFRMKIVASKLNYGLLGLGSFLDQDTKCVQILKTCSQLPLIYPGINLSRLPLFTTGKVEEGPIQARFTICSIDAFSWGFAHLHPSKSHKVAKKVSDHIDVGFHVHFVENLMQYHYS